VSGTIIQFPAERWQRYRTTPCPPHPKGERWKHGEQAADGTRFCRAQDRFCRCDHKAACDTALRQHADGTKFAHGDAMQGGGRYCARRDLVGCRCDDTIASLCAQYIKEPRARKKGAMPR
jgi:hypothetical protein